MNWYLWIPAKLPVTPSESDARAKLKRPGLAHSGGLWPNVGDGLDGYAPAPKLPLRVNTFT